MEFFRVIRVKIYINDINDHRPTFPSLRLHIDAYELSAIGARFPLPVAVDADSGRYSVVEYQLMSTSGSAPFRLSSNESSAVEESGELYLVLDRGLDRETVPEYRLTVSARDGGTPSLTGSLEVVVRVVDANDNAPEFERQVYELVVAESTPVGATVGVVRAVDRDEGDNGRVAYRVS